MEEGEKEAAVLAAAAGSVVESLVAAVEEIAAISDFRNAYKKQFCNLSRRIKLLAPMFEELKESKDPIPPRAVRALEKFNGALDSAKDLLRLGSEGSKIFLLLERDRIMERFQEITSQLEVALNEISFNEIDISDEVKEQVELVHAQFKRAKERINTTDPELYADLSSVCHMNADARIDSAMLQRLAEKLQLMTISDLKQESFALHEMVDASGDPGEVIEKMSMLLKRIKDFVQTQKPEMGTPMSAKVIPSHGTSKTPVVPDDFRCPISLELMGDPVIVSTGQTYEREFIKKWLEAGHNTCPKTQQKLSSTSLTPNYVLRSLIAQWCKANGMDPPKRPARTGKPLSVCSAGEHAKVVDLLHKLSSQNLEDQQSAAGELRLLAKRNTDNRICIAEAGAIPLLVNLLSTQDVRTQEHAVTALLNLSIYEENKGKIIVSGAVPGIVHVLKRGSMEARENAAATLFSLSVVDRNKVIIGESGAIPPLVLLLSEGSQRGKKDAATALFNLCIYQGNKGKAVRAGVIQTLMGLLTDPEGAMMDEALAIMAILSSHPDGKAAIRAVEALPMLVKVIRSGSPRNKENAAAVLVHLCNGEQQQQHLAELQEQGMMVPLQEMVESGTNRGKRKAAQLLEQMTRFLEQQKKAEAQAHAQAQGWTQAPLGYSKDTASSAFTDL
ncbi:U-box domain-containing protein 13 [Musa troglodytarum]|uniref:U-box domain-containing protein 12 n=1 Tax=Musa troglodytarum TaxID=320322 RepID=A0A9E7FQK6_9LILI|nr:U-box domain-containing protein 13 [Musa troglodytarum]